MTKPQRNQNVGALNGLGRIPTGGSRSRSRRNAAAFIQQENTVREGIAYDQDGRQRVALAPRSPFFINARGELDFRASDGLVVSSGSPYSLRLDAGDTIQVSSGKVEAVATSTRGYDPTKPREWTSGVPSGVSSALDQLVARVVELEQRLATAETNISNNASDIEDVEVQVDQVAADLAAHTNNSSIHV